jgi:hypothetical protein
MNEEQAEAFMRAGIAQRQVLLGEEGGSAPLEEVAQQLGVTEADILALAARHELVAIEDGTGSVSCPRWQFDRSGNVLPGLIEVIAVLRRSPGFTAITPLRFFVEPHPRTHGRPLDALRAGNVQSVLSAAAQESD